MVRPCRLKSGVGRVESRSGDPRKPLKVSSLSGNAPPIAVEAPTDPHADTLGRRAARSVVYLLSQTVLVKVLQLGSTVVLGWLLAKDDFGVVALATTVSIFAGLLQQAGVREVLIRRGRRMDLWTGPAFWMGMALGLASAGLMLLSAPVIAWAYSQPRIIGPLAVLALGALFNAAAIVPDAMLSYQLRFAKQAMVNVIAAIATAGMSIALSVLTWKMKWTGWGAYCIVAGPCVAAIVRTVMLWWFARPQVGRRLQVWRWRHLYADTSVLFLSTLFGTITWQAGYLILRAFEDDSAVGVYFFAFNLSTQTIFMLTGSLMSVLFPALSSVQEDPQRQVRMFNRASKLLAVVAVPLCVLQAAMSDPALRLVFHEKWVAAILPLQLLSLSMALQVTNGACVSLINAQGRFVTMMKVSLWMAIVYIATVLGATWGWGMIGMVWAVCSCSLLSGILLPYVATRPAGGRWGDVAATYAAPWTISALTVGGVWAAVAWLVPATVSPFVRFMLIPMLSGPLYLWMTRRFMRPEWDELNGRLARLLPRRLRPAATPV